MDIKGKWKWVIEIIVKVFFNDKLLCIIIKYCYNFEYVKEKKKNLYRVNIVNENFC